MATVRSWSTLRCALVLLTLVMFTFLSASDPNGQTRQPKSEKVPEPLNIYVAPAACSDRNDGHSEAQAVCSIKRANRIAHQAWDIGQARGDVNVLFAPNVFSSPESIWTFSAARNRYVRFVPSWYLTDEAIQNHNSSDFPTFNGAREKNTDRWLTIRPDINRGGSFQLTGLRVLNYRNGVFIDGGRIRPKAGQGLIRNRQPSIRNATITDCVFERIGNKWAPPGKNIDYSVISPWNTDRINISRNIFRNIENADGFAHLHAIYAYGSTNGVISNNTFDTGTGNPIDLRDRSSGWAITSNRFRRFGSQTNPRNAATVSEFYCGSNCALGVECPMTGTPTFSGNISDSLTYTGRKMPFWRVLVPHSRAEYICAN